MPYPYNNNINNQKNSFNYLNSFNVSPGNFFNKTEKSPLINENNNSNNFNLKIGILGNQNSFIYKNLQDKFEGKGVDIVNEADDDIDDDDDDDDEDEDNNNKNNIINNNNNEKIENDDNDDLM